MIRFWDFMLTSSPPLLSWVILPQIPFTNPDTGSAR
jgi:hypothetical protein